MTKIKAPQTPAEMLDEFCREVEKSFGYHVEDNTSPSPELIAHRMQRTTGWQELSAIYTKAARLLEKYRRMDAGHRDPFKVQRWLRRDGRFPDDANDVGRIISAAAAAMDSACTWEIVGDCVFQGEDEKYYVGTVEFVVAPANPEYVKELLEEDSDEE